MIRSMAIQFVLCASLAAASWSALAAPLSLDACIDCHGIDGMGKSDPTYPVIAGMPAGHIEEAIFAYIDGARRCVMEPRMCETVAPLSDEQVAVAANYFSSQVRGPTHEPFDVELAARGAELHERHCASCHVPPHDEDAAHAIGIPLNGQRADYVRFAMVAYLRGDRDPLLETMAHELHQLEPGDFEALVNYYSSYRSAE
ncbi:MAG: c-type cytochrome [Woeseiaceae bacterium]